MCMRKYLGGILSIFCALTLLANSSMAQAEVDCDLEYLYWYRVNTPSCIESKMLALIQVGISQPYEYGLMSRLDVILSNDIGCENINICICYIGVPAAYVEWWGTGRLLTTSIPPYEICVINRHPLP